MRIARSTAVIVALTVLHTQALADEPPKPSDALLVVGTGADVSQELADDITEAIAFSIAKDTGMSFLPKEVVTAKLDYESPGKPGTCIFNNECLRKVHRSLKTRHFIVARLARGGAGYKITVVRVTNTASGDVTAAGDTPNGPSDVINKMRALVTQSLKTPIATFVLSVNEQDAIVEVGGKKVGTGSTTIKVKPGTYRIRVSKKGFVTFEAKLQCTAGQQCIVPVNIIPKQAVVKPPDPPVKTPGADNTPKILKIAGWSTAGVGVAMTIVGVVYGLQASDAQSELDVACATSPCSITADRASELTSQGESGSSIFNGVGITGIVLTVLGAGAAITGHLIKPKTATKSTIDVQPTWAPDGSFFMRARVRF